MDFDGRMGEYFQKNCVLYRQHGQVKQLVVPQAARDVVPTLGHLIPWAGHLEKRKTTACIKCHFLLAWSEPRGSPVLQELPQLLQLLHSSPYTLFMVYLDCLVFLVNYFSYFQHE